MNELEIIAESFKELNLSGIYSVAPHFFDSIIFLIVFTSISMLTIGKKYEGRAGSALTIALGVIFAIAFSIWEYNSDFTLSRVGPLAALLVLIFLFLLLFSSIRQFKIKKLDAFLISFVLSYITVEILSPGILEWLKEADELSLIYAFIRLGIWVTAIILGFRFLEMLVKKSR